MKNITLIFSLFILTPHAFAQVGIGNTSPRGALEVTSSDTGFIAPQASLTDTGTALPVINPQGGALAAGTIVYNTNTANDVTPGYYYWDGSIWVRMAAATATPNNSWEITGNNNATSGTHFLGTTNAQALDFRTNNILRFRVANANQVHAMNNGTAVAPFYSWSADTNMGIFRAGTDILGFSTNGNERMRINNNGQVLINTVTPTEPNQFEVRVTSGTYWPINGYNTGIGSGTGFFWNSNASSGYNALEGVTAGTNAGIWGWSTTSGTGVRGTVTNTVLGWAGYFEGDVGCTGLYYGSDERWKKNIRSISATSTLDKIMLLSPKKYEWKADEFPGMGFDPTRSSYGFIAQDLEKIFPDLVTNKKSTLDPKEKHTQKSEGKNVTGYYMVDYIGLIPILTKAIQEQQQIIEKQQQIIENFDERIKALENK